MSYLHLASIAVLAALIHRLLILWLYRSWFKQGLIADAAFHYCVISTIKKYGSYEGIKEFLIRNKPDTYPILFHRFCSIFPISFIRKHSYFPNLLIWVFGFLFLAMYVHYVESKLIRNDNLNISLLFILFFLSSASNLSLDMNGLNYIVLSERLLSRILCGTYFVSLAVFLNYHDNISLFISIFSGSLTLISSMFGRQALFFITPMVALIDLDLYPVIILFASISGAILIDGRYFLQGLLDMKEYSIAYKIHTKHSRYYKTGLSRFIDLKVLLSPNWSLSPRLYEIEHNEPTRLIFRYPEILLYSVVLVFYSFSIERYSASIILAAILVYLATSTELLRHYGEANRYIEFALCGLLPFLIAEYAATVNIPGWIWVFYFLWIALVSYRKIKSIYTQSFPGFDQLQMLVENISLDENSTIFTVPFSLGAAIHLRSGCQALMYQGSAVNINLYRKFMEEMPFLKRDWQSLAIEYSVTHIIVEKAYFDLTAPLMGWKYNFSDQKIIVEDDRYIAYEIVL